MKAKILNIAILLLVVCMLFLIVSRARRSKTKPNDRLKERYEMVSKRYLGLNIPFIYEILGNDLNFENGEAILFVYSGNDCGPCLEKAFKTFINYHKTSGLIPSYIVGLNTNVGEDRYAFNYEQKIYYDLNMKFYSAINLYTPCFLKIDTTTCIVEIIITDDKESNNHEDIKRFFSSGYEGS